MSSARWLAALASTGLGLAACPSGSGSSGLLGLEGRDRQVLAETYPPGTPREQVRAREAEPLVFSIHECDFGTRDQDPALDQAIRQFQKDFPDYAPGCDRVRLARTGWVTAIGGLAYYQDYVFYDDDDQVLVAYRTFIQRSAR